MKHIQKYLLALALCLLSACAITAEPVLKSGNVQFTGGTINGVYINGMLFIAPASDDQLLISDSTTAGTWRTLPNCTDTGGNHLNYTTSTNAFSCGTSGASAALSSITAATGANTIANGNNSQVWNAALTTDSKVGFLFGETSAATNGTSTSGVPNQSIFRHSTLASSTATAWDVYVRGNFLIAASPTTRQLLAYAGGIGTSPYSFAVAPASGMKWSAGTPALVLNDESGSIISIGPTVDISVAGTPSVISASTTGVNITGTLTADNIGAGTWLSWTPTRTGWTDVGTPTVTANYTVLQKVVHFEVKIVPATTVATVAGASYINLPFSAVGLSGACQFDNLTTKIGVGSCVVDVANSRVYVPTQGATANTLTIAGWYHL